MTNTRVTNSCHFGGGGGGAVQLVAGSSIVIGPGASAGASGGVNAGGCNGVQASSSCQANNGGSGGGSGGAILVEAPVVQLIAKGVLAVNGGTSSDFSPPTPGLLNATPAGGNRTPGAGGAAGNLTRIDGLFGGNGNGGGGGGGVGRIRINTISGNVSVDAAGILSPGLGDASSHDGMAVTTLGFINVR